MNAIVASALILAAQSASDERRAIEAAEAMPVIRIPGDPDETDVAKAAETFKQKAADLESLGYAAKDSWDYVKGDYFLYGTWAHNAKAETYADFLSAAKGLGVEVWHPVAWRVYDARNTPAGIKPPEGIVGQCDCRLCKSGEG